jgi:hypothetical protein
MATLLLLVAAGLQVALPSVSSLPEQTELAPRRAREPLRPAVPLYPEVLSNPMFAPDRKADASIEPPAGGMGDYAVLGIATAGTGMATALVRSPDGSILRLQPGGDLDGWTLIQVQLSSLTFQKNGERHTLTIEKKPPPPPASPLPSNNSASNSDDGNGQ